MSSFHSHKHTHINLLNTYRQNVALIWCAELCTILVRLRVPHEIMKQVRNSCWQHLAMSRQEWAPTQTFSPSRVDAELLNASKRLERCIMKPEHEEGRGNITQLSPSVRCFRSSPHSRLCPTLDPRFRHFLVHVPCNRTVRKTVISSSASWVLDHHPVSVTYVLVSGSEPVGRVPLQVFLFTINL